MKVLMVTTFLNHGGGAEKAALSEADLLRRKGHQVKFLAFEHPNGAPPDYPVSANGLTDKAFVREQSLWAKVRLFGELLNNREASEQMKRALERERPDVVHMHRVKPFSPALYAVLAQAAVPTVMTLHDHYATCPSSTRVLGDGRPCPLDSCQPMFAARERCVGGSSLQTIVALTEFAYRRHVARDSDVVAKYLVPSMFLKNWSERAGLLPERLSYLPNFVSVPTPFRAARGEMVTYVGRLSEEKGLPTLISAASRLPDVRFQLVGDGPLRAELERLITKLGLSNVMLTGSLRDERLQEAFDRSCLLVLPSECFENAPMVILEAYSFGLPVIGSNRGGIPELVHNGQTGFLFEPGNADDLAEKVALVVGDPDAAQRMGEAGRALVVETFAEESHYQMLLSAYQEVLSAERAAPSLTGAR